MRVSGERLKVLLGSRSALSWPVIIGLVITGLLLSFTYLRLIPDQPRIVILVAAAGAAGTSVAVLVVAQSLGNREGWVRPHPTIVLVGIALASLVRSIVTSVLVNWLSAGSQLESNPAARTIASLLVTVTLGLFMAASATLARERAEANLALLIEQARLRLLAENADEELIRAGVDLRNRARALLEPTIEDIRDLISGEISESAALEVSERINAAVNDVVRPASRELARSPLIVRDELSIHESTPLRLLKDRMDITQAIRPWWWLVLSWGVLIPGPLLLGAQFPLVVQWMAISVLAVPLFFAVRAIWPREWRNLPIPLGLGILLVLYTLTNIGFRYLTSHVLPVIAGSESWASVGFTGSIIQISLGMLVSILATLDVYGRHTRAILIDTNLQLEELIARIKRETWLLHRSVSLAVHGTVQSALISTAMRLSATDRTPETVADARRRLEDALIAISTEQSEGISLRFALEDLQNLWNPLVEVTFEINPEADQRLSEDFGLRRCVIEICLEAASNAIRHGHARVISLRVESFSDLVQVTAVDDGEGISQTAQAGLGSQMLNDTCLRWNIETPAAGGTQLTAVLA